MRIINFLHNYINKPLEKLFNTPEFTRAISNQVSGGTKSIHNYPTPALDDTITLTTDANLTIVKFTGPIDNNFTFSLITGSGASLGDKVYFMVTGGNPSGVITLDGDINNVLCGGTDNPQTFQPSDNINNVLEWIYDGDFWTGVDNC